ncbi:MAG: C1 family peptidase, partial [Cyanobacteria bacterium J06635_1]
MPDYPDIRDYNLQSEQLQQSGRLIREEATASVESLADSVLQIIEGIKDQSTDPDIKKKLLIVHKSIQKRVFGEIVLVNVKHHKILRKGIPDCQEVVDLKLKLEWLKTKRVGDKPFLPSYLYQKYVAEKAEFKDVKTRYTEWLQDSEFDDFTEFLVKRFQESHGKIYVDGIVGFQTNISIEKILEEEDRTPLIKDISDGQDVIELKSKLALLNKVGKESFEASELFEKYASDNPQMEGLKVGYQLWLEDSRFDDFTEFLVKEFQEASKIQVDGIVWVETRAAIQKLLLDEKLSVNASVQFKSAYNNSNELSMPVHAKSNVNGAEAETVVDFLSIPPLINRIIFNTLFHKSKLFSEAVQSSKNVIIENSFDQVFGKRTTRIKKKLSPEEGESTATKRATTKNKIKRVIESYKEEIKAVIPEPSLLEGSWEIEDLLPNKDAYPIIAKGFNHFFEHLHNEVLAESNLSGHNSPNQQDISEDIKNYVRVHQQTYFTHEPMMSVISQFVSPLAQHDSVEGAYADGLDKFLLIFYLLVVVDDKTKVIESSSEIADDVRVGYERLELDKPIAYSTEDAKNVLAALLKVYREIVDKEKYFDDGFIKAGRSLWETDGSKFHNHVSDDQYAQVLDEFCDYCLTKSFYNWFKSIIQGLVSDTATIQKILGEDDYYSLNRMYVFEMSHCSSGLAFPRNEPNTLTLPIARNFYDEKGASSYVSPSVNRRNFFFLPAVVDLSFWCSPVEDQGSLNSCSAHAGVGLSEFFARRQLAKKVNDLSPLFLYKVTRNLMHQTGDTGASIRETMKSMVLFGVPPEEYWPYDEDKLDEEPTPFCYSFAQNFQALKYFRLDYASMPKDLLLFEIQAVLAAGFPCIFGFTLYSSAQTDENARQGYIPYPDPKKDKQVGGHAAMAVGYDDFKIMPTVSRPQPCDRNQGPRRGALLIRNSWGPEWGQGGYGWLPYDYVLGGLTSDWWSLLKSEWFEIDKFGLGTPWLAAMD